ncbi:MAG: FecR domain-containing protein [Chitinophagaceae bacterium]|nr:FecR domain-containing protein [Chitinophagaceae bacterium]MCW5926764.1 FecR domain-containing protein [Chitinophagaceae bacterium]
MAYTEQQIAQLILKHFREEITSPEMDELERWLSEAPQNRHFFNGLRNEDDIIHLIESEELDLKNNVQEKILQEIQRRIQEEEELVDISHTTTPILKRRVWYAAAAVLVLLCAGSMWWATGTETEGQPVSPALIKSGSDVLPGSDRAILTLSDGKQVELNEDGTQVITDGDLAIANADGELVYSAAGPVVFNTMTTPKGGQYRVVLADGSKVWLNAASSITFPSRFDGNTREVNITGEVYFDIEEDKKKPFIVKTQGGMLEVLGTQFNVNAYEDEAYEATTLVEGSVRVTIGAKEIKLKPGQQSRVLEQSEKIGVVEVNVDDVTGWRNNLFIFNNADIPTIMRQLGRWYDLDISYRGVVPKKPYKGKIPRDFTLDEVLNALKLAGVNLEIYDKTLIVTGVN